MCVISVSIAENIWSRRRWWQAHINIHVQLVYFNFPFDNNGMRAGERTSCALLNWWNCTQTTRFLIDFQQNRRGRCQVIFKLFLHHRVFWRVHLFLHICSHTCTRTHAHTTLCGCHTECSFLVFLINVPLFAALCKHQQQQQQQYQQYQCVLSWFWISKFEEG